MSRWVLLVKQGGSLRFSRARQPPAVRFVWGKSWNIPGIIAAVAEHLEQFTVDGAPQRSWLSMRFWRINEQLKETVPGGQPLPTQTFSPEDLAISPDSVPDSQVQVHTSSEGERLDEIAARYYPNQPTTEVPALWRLLASFNNLQDPLNIPAGFLLRIPPLSVLGGGS